MFPGLFLSLLENFPLNLSETLPICAAIARKFRQKCHGNLLIRIVTNSIVFWFLALI